MLIAIDTRVTDVAVVVQHPITETVVISVRVCHSRVLHEILLQQALWLQNRHGSAAAHQCHGHDRAAHPVAAQIRRETSRSFRVLLILVFSGINPFGGLQAPWRCPDCASIMLEFLLSMSRHFCAPRQCTARVNYVTS